MSTYGTRKWWAIGALTLASGGAAEQTAAAVPPNGLQKGAAAHEEAAEQGVATHDHIA